MHSVNIKKLLLWTVAILVAATTGIALGQVFIFNRDLLNLRITDPDAPKSYTQVKATSTWLLVDSLNPSLSAVSVGIVDTGVDTKHPEFFDVNFGETSPDAKTNLADAHGTKIGGIIGANNLSATSSGNYRPRHTNGIVSGVKDLPYTIEARNIVSRNPITGNTFYNSFKTFSEANKLARGGVPIINISLSPSTEIGCGVSNSLSPFFGGVFLFNPDTLFVVSAGNVGIDANFCAPANLGFMNNVITVGAVKLNDERAVFQATDGGSNFGNSVSIAAPGGEISFIYTPSFYKSTPPNLTLDDYDTNFPGTSAAAPFVTGVAAILKSLKPSLSPFEIKKILTESADPIFTSDLDELNKKLGSACDPGNRPDFRGCRLNALSSVCHPMVLNCTPVPPIPYTLNPHTLFYASLDSTYDAIGSRFIPELADTPSVPDTANDCSISESVPNLYTTVPGQFNGALKASGRGRVDIPSPRDGQILCNNRPIRLIGDSFPDYTAGFWMKTSSPPPQLGYIFFMFGPGDVRPLWIFLESDGSLTTLHHPPNPSPSNILSSHDPRIFDGKWHHYLFVFSNTSNTITLSIDGLLAEQIPITTPTRATGANNAELLTSDTTRGFVPSLLLDDFFVENRAWSQTDITNFLATGAIPPNNPHQPEPIDPDTLPEPIPIEMITSTMSGV